MRGAFPEAEINVPVDMVKAITCIPTRTIATCLPQPSAGRPRQSSL